MITEELYSPQQLCNRVTQLEIQLAAVNMNLRDEFAKAALPAILDMASCLDGKSLHTNVAQWSYAMADAMLKERQ